MPLPSEINTGSAIVPRADLMPLTEDETIFENSLPQIDKQNHYATGGPDGISNIQALILGGRTKWLKAKVDAFIAGNIKVLWAEKADKLATARTIGGVSFDGSANINLPGVNTAGNQNTTGNAATATKLAAARTINGVSFDGSGNIIISSAVESDLAPKLGGALDANGKTINKSSVRGIADAFPATGTTHTFDYANGDMQRITCPAAGTLTFAFSNMPNSLVSAFVVDLVNAGNCTIIHPTEMKFAYGAAPTYTIAGTDRVLITKDSSNILTLTIIAQDIKVVS